MSHCQPTRDELRRTERTLPESITVVQSGIVIPVSAILVPIGLLRNQLYVWNGNVTYDNLPYSSRRNLKHRALTFARDSGMKREDAECVIGEEIMR